MSKEKILLKALKKIASKDKNHIVSSDKNVNDTCYLCIAHKALAEYNKEPEARRHELDLNLIDKYGPLPADEGPGD